MPARAAENQAGGDAAHIVQNQEIRDSHLDSVRAVAGRWEQGLRGLLGLTGIAGLVGAPFAAGTLTPETQLMVGILLALVLATAGAGLMLAMSAAYGSIRVVEPPASRAKRETMRWALAERGRTQLLWGRRLAVVALLMFAATVVLVWANPTSQGPQLRIETRYGVTYCGLQLNSPKNTVAVLATPEGRIQFPTADIASLTPVPTCPPQP